MSMLNITRTGLPFFGLGYDMNSVTVFAFCMDYKKYYFSPIYKGRFHCIPVYCVSGYDLQVLLGRQIRGQ